jgi:hypothetical protein
VGGEKLPKISVSGGKAAENTDFWLYNRDREL